MGKARRATLAIAAALSLTVITVAGAFAGYSDGDRSKALERAIDGGRAKNVILIIGDGMGASEITLARNYEYGAGGRMTLDGLPFTGQVTTYSVREDNPSKPDYTSESASTATAWSTGRKTSDGRISTSPGTDVDLRTILELAQREGLRTGNVTTSELTDATPAAPMSHVRLRGCQGPLNMATCPQDRKSVGGPGSIAEQGIDHKIDVLLGGGKARYDQVIPAGEPNAGKTLWQVAQEKGYATVTDRAGLLAASSSKKLLGLFNPGNMAVRWNGLEATKTPSGPQRCNEAAPTGNEPTLAEMTAKAIDLLDRDDWRWKKKRKGFFLQVESASIDKRDHSSQPCEQIGETVQLDQTVKVALDYAKRNRDTLVIVTADHSHTSQIVEADASPPGFSSILTTDEGENMMVTYGTTAGATPASVSQEHTGATVPIAAAGPQAANVVGVIDQTDVFRIMERAIDD